MPDIGGGGGGGVPHIGGGGGGGIKESAGNGGGGGVLDSELLAVGAHMSASSSSLKSVKSKSLIRRGRDRELTN